jgi:hypothetical protein
MLQRKYVFSSKFLQLLQLISSPRLTYLIVCGFFNATVSSSDDTVPNIMVIRISNLKNV